MNLFEASLSRFLRDVENVQFAIITAWRQKNIKLINQRNVAEMIRDIQSNGLSFIKIIGHGQEEINGKVEAVNEPSLIVKNAGYKGEQQMEPKDFDKYIISLGKAFEQWGIVLKNSQNKIQLIQLKDENGNNINPHIVNTYFKIKINKVSDFFSTLKDNKFVFEYLHPDWSKLSNYIEGMGMETLWKRELNEIIKGGR